MSSPTVKRANQSISVYKPTNLTPFKRNHYAAMSKDIAIVHESKIMRNLVERATRGKEIPKRNPILQDGDEPCYKFKSSIRRLASADKMSESMNERIPRARNTGEFNYIYNPPCQDPKAQGVRTFVHHPSESADENQRPLRKQVRPKSEYGRDPIVSGETNIKRRMRGAGVQADEQKTYNDKKFLLPSERGNSKRGNVFRQMTLTLGDNDFSNVAQRAQTERAVSPGARPMTAIQEKMRGYIKGCLEYSSGPAFRDDGITEKCTSATFVSSPVADKTFARVRTLF